MTENIDRLYDEAVRAFRQGNFASATDLLKQVLTFDPEHAAAHGLLASTLLHQKRLHAAEMEARMALALDPDLPLAHWSASAVLTAKRQFAEAEDHVNRILEMDPSDADAYRQLATLRNLSGKKKDVWPLLEKSLELDPESPETLAEMGEHRLSEGNDDAQRYAEEALGIEPQHLDSLVLMGYVHLRRGRIQEARDHAIWALRLNPSGERSLRLMAAIKARKNPLMGLWWRWQTWMGDLGDGRAVLVLLGAFVLYRLGTIIATQTGNEDYAGLISIFWLAVCAYTWFAPAIFNRSVRKELEQVQLRREF